MDHDWNPENPHNVIDCFLSVMQLAP